jgi:hypothetical protein
LSIGATTSERTGLMLYALAKMQERTTGGSTTFFPISAKTVSDF